MRTLQLPDMVKRVSSMVGNQSVKSSTNNNLIIISTEVWDFHFERLPNVGYYVYDSTTITDVKKNKELSELKKSLMREIICHYGIIISL